MSEQKLAMIDGTYPSLMAGGVVATVLSDEDLNEFRGADYWGKRFYAAGGNSVLNRPYNGSFSLDVIRAGGGVTIQVFSTYDENPDGRPTTYQRTCQSNTSAWQPWEEIVTSDGSYPNLGAGKDGDGNQISTTYAKQTGSYPTLGAGYLAKQGKINNDTVYTGWQKIGTIHYADLIAYQVYSCIMLVNGVFRGSTGSDGNPKSGAIEIEYRKYNNVNPGDTRIGILFGDLDPNNFCFNILSNFDMEIWINVTAVEHVSATFEIISEQLSNKQNCNIFDFDCVTQSASAPANAIYAVVRNIASYAESIPVASQTVIGGAKMWVSNGKLYIKTK